MYPTSNDYKTKIYESSTKHLLKVSINNIPIESKYILGFNPSHKLFSNDEFTLGAVEAKTVELKLHKNAVSSNIQSVYISSGIVDEEIPIGYFNVDEISKDDNYTVTLKLIDDMIKFNVNYDGSSLIEQKGYAEIIEILQDICLKAGVELRFYFFFRYA